MQSILKSFILLISDGKLYSKKIICLNLNINISLLNILINLAESFNLKIEQDQLNLKLLDTVYLLDENLIKKTFPFCNLYYFLSIPSTNQFLLEQKELTDYSICISEYQSKGRGQHNNTWVSPFAQNLYFSFAWQFKQQKLPSKISILSPLISIIVLNVLKKHNKRDELKLKWPNDIYLNNKKVCGILIENKNKNFFIIGIGINLYMQDHNEINQAWTNLSQNNNYIDKNLLVIDLISALTLHLPQIINGNYLYLFNQWAPNDIFFQKKITFIDKNSQEQITGIEQGINLFGQLLLQINQNVFAFSVGDISLIKNNLFIN